MTRAETLDLLEVLAAAYPYARITNPCRMADAWMLAFAEEDASDIYKAARHHMMISPFFPTIADIQKSRQYTFMFDHQRPDTKALPNSSKYELNAKCDIIPETNEFCDLMDDILADLGLQLGDDEDV